MPPPLLSRASGSAPAGSRSLLGAPTTVGALMEGTTMKTKQVKKGYHLIPCPGEAHSNPYIDNCMLCAPRWGLIEVLDGCKTLNEHREAVFHAREKGSKSCQ